MQETDRAQEGTNGVQPHSTRQSSLWVVFSTRSGASRTRNAVSALFLAALGVACASPPVPEPAEDTDLGEPPAARTPDEVGPYTVGFTTVRVERPDLGELVLEVWYPASPAPDASPDVYEEGILQLQGGAFRDAPVDRRGAPYPLVAFSHGFGGIRFQSAYLTEFLASHGLVVVAPDHRGSTLMDLDADHTADVAVRRPRDISDAVDAVRDGVVAGLDVDASQFGMVGHSFGAWTALAVGGGVLDGAGFEQVCATEDRAACAFFEGQHFDVDAANLYAKPDPRATVTVMLAPGAWYAFSPDGSGLAGVRAPLVLGGTKDGDMPYEAEAVGTYEALGAPKALGSLQGAGHWGFSNMCDLLPLEDCAGVEGGFMDPARVRALVDSRTLAHLRVNLLGRDEDRAWLVGADDMGWEQE